jgi:hypothetical protein
MARELDLVRLPFSSREIRLAHRQLRVVERGEQLGGHLVRCRGSQVGVYRPHPRTPRSLDRHREPGIPASPEVNLKVEPGL